MPWKCPVCGAENPDDADRCMVCGTPRPSEAESLKLEEPRSVEAPSAAGGEAVEAPSGTGEVVQEAAPVAEEAPAEVVEEAVEEEVAAPVPAAEEKPSPPPSGRWVLVVVNSPARELLGQKIPLLFETFGKISVGRSLENVVVVPDSTVSRKHAVLYLEDGRLYIEDLGSTNGTYVYDREEGSFKRVEGRVELRPGDLVRLGHGTILRVELES